MRRKTITNDSISFKEVYVLRYGAERVGEYETLDEVKTNMILDVMKRNHYYMEPDTTQDYLFYDYSVSRVLRPVIDPTKGGPR